MPSRKIWQEYSTGSFIAAVLILAVLSIGSVVVTVLLAIPYLMDPPFARGWFATGCAIWSWFFPAMLLYQVYFFARMATRVEVLKIEGGSLFLTTRQIGLERSHKYPVCDIRDLELFPVRGTWHERGFVTFGITPGSLGFEYKGKRLRFGTSLDDGEAFYLLQTIRRGMSEQMM